MASASLPHDWSIEGPFGANHLTTNQGEHYRRVLVGIAKLLIFHKLPKTEKFI
jgi:hypothetical protein